MIRILTSLVALFTVTSIHTQAALNQFSKLLTNNIVGEQTKNSLADQTKQLFTKEIFKQLIKQKNSCIKKKTIFLYCTIPPLDSINLIKEKKTKCFLEQKRSYSSVNNEVFHIRSPNSTPSIYTDKDRINSSLAI